MRERGLINRHNISDEDPPSNGRPIGEVLRDMVGHIAEIIRSEMRLVTLELRQEVVELKSAAIAIAIGNILLLYAGMLLLLGLVYALSTIWPSWVAAVVVGGGIGIIGAVVLRAGIQKIKHPRLK
jgi:uncharacterized membrane protein YqjE